MPYEEEKKKGTSRRCRWRVMAGTSRLFLWIKEKLATNEITNERSGSFLNPLQSLRVEEFVKKKERKKEMRFLQLLDTSPSSKRLYL